MTKKRTHKQFCTTLAQSYPQNLLEAVSSCSASKLGALLDNVAVVVAISEIVTSAVAAVVSTIFSVVSGATVVLTEVILVLLVSA